MRIYRCRILKLSIGWDWVIHLMFGRKEFLITPSIHNDYYSSPKSARRAAKRIADKLNIEISFEGLIYD